MLHLEHVGIAAPTDPDVIALFEDILSRTVYKTEVVESEGVTTYFLDAGGAKLELLTSTDAGSPIARFIERRGPGLHHLAFEVDDIEDAFRRASDRGLRVTSPAPTTGADGKRVFFIHPKSASGVLIEFCQSSRSIARASEEVLAGSAVRIERVGKSGRPHLLVLADWNESDSYDELARTFESTHDVTFVRRSSDPRPALSADVLREAQIEIDVVICGVDPGRRLLAETTGRPIVVLVRASDRLPETWSESACCDGLLVLCPTEMTTRLDELPVTNCAFFPGFDGGHARADLRIAMPLIRRHLAQYSDSSGRDNESGTNESGTNESGTHV